MHTNRTKARRHLLTPAAAACLVALAGCAGSHPPTAAKPDAATVAALPPAILSLIEAGEREARHPVSAAINAPPPDGIEGLLNPTASMNSASARQGLDQVLAGISPPEAATPTRPTDEEKNSESLRHYIQGREKLLTGDPATAIGELRAATELDPASGEPWRELGEAQLALGLTGEAIRSFRASAATGLREPRTLELIGRAALERGDHTEATRYLAAALASSPERADPALNRLILVELSRALAPQGYIVAAKEAIEKALTSPATLSASTRYSAELGAIFRRQGELWRDVGDALCRLGEYQEAAAAYRHASELPTVDGKPIRPRIVYAWMKSGRPSAAAVAVIDDIALAHGRISELDTSLLRFITTHGANPTQVSDAVASLEAIDDGIRYPSVGRDLSLARAAILPPAQAQVVLRSHLANHPTDVRAAAQLLDMCASPNAAAGESIRLVAGNPTSAKAMAEALLRSRHNLDQVYAALESASPKDAGTLLRAYLIAKQGRLDESLGLLKTIDAQRPAASTAAIAMVEVALDLGSPDKAVHAVEELRKQTDPTSTRLLAQVLILTQHYREALDIIRPLAIRGDADIETLTTAGDIAMRLGRADDAEEWISRAADLDPYDDRPPSLLMVLHSSGGLRPDPAKLTRTVRDLRQASPDSRTLRLVRARETMRRAQWTQAESELQKLVEEDPGDPAPMELLASSWQEHLKADPAAAEPIRAWLLGLLARRPQSAVLLGGMATLEIACGSAANAEAPLRAALKTGAGPDVSRVLERVLREQLGRMDEADQLAHTRLDGHPLTVVGAIESAELLLRTKKPQEALAALQTSIDPTIDLAPDQAAGLLALVGRCVAEVKDPRNTAAMCRAVALFDRCIATGQEVPVEVHQRRLEAMTSCPDQGVPRLLEAAKLCSSQFPALQGRPYVMVSQRLRSLGRGPAAREFMPGAIAAAPSDTDLLEEWYIVVVTCGTAADARPMIDAIDSAGQLRTVLQRLMQRDQGVLNPAEIHDLRAEAAYLLGNFYAEARKPTDADAAYELALSYDPRHAWASNNLGYALADRGMDIERASKLLEQAVEQLREEASVLDSLGWLRYKQGIILNENDPATGLVKRRGALSLLENAAGKPRGQQDNTILDHLGDARWLAGKRNEAVQAWTKANQISKDTLRLAEQVRQARRQAEDNGIQQEPAEDSAVVVEAKKLDESTTIKIEAAANGGPVRVAPQISNPDPHPPLADPDAAAKNPNN